MALQKEIWLRTIVEALFADNTFMAKSFDADEFVKAGKKVHIPNASAKAKASKGPISRPKTASEMVDTDLEFDIDEFYTDPIYIQNADKYELSYDKRESVVRRMRSALQDEVAVNMIQKWTPTASDRIRKILGPKFSRKDVLKAATKFNQDDIPETGRFMLLDAVMYEELLEDLTEAQVNAFLANADTKRGVLGKLYGFEFMQRSKMVEGEKYALAWHRDYVCRAIGDHEMFSQENDPLYFGDVLSFLVRAGGSKMDNNGIGTLKIEGVKDEEQGEEESLGDE